MSPSRTKEFWATLLGQDHTPKVKPLSKKDVWKAVTTFDEAFINDPVCRYLDENEILYSHVAMMDKMWTFLAFLYYTRQTIAITINRGASFIVASPDPLYDSKYGVKDTLTCTTLDILYRGMCKLDNKERLQRKREYTDKMYDLREEKIPDWEDMICINHVCTKPDFQKRGYASTLLESVTRLADQSGVSCWVESTNIANEAFYNTHGFKTVGEVLLGDNNPSWHGKPVMVHLMVREPKLCKDLASKG